MKQIEERKMFLSSYEIVAFAELQEFLDSPIKNYSSGMKARLGFAVATMVRPDILIVIFQNHSLLLFPMPLPVLLVRPDILIVDEILSVGDYAFRKKCEQRMEEMLSKDLPVILCIPMMVLKKDKKDELGIDSLRSLEGQRRKGIFPVSL